MPLFGKSNKSQPPAGNSSNQSSSTVSSVHEPPQQRYQQLEDNARRPHPARSHSHRHSSNISLDRPPVNVAASVNEAEASPPPDRSAHHDHRFSYHRHPENAQQSGGEEPKKSFRSRIFGSSSKEPPPPQDPNAAAGRVVNRRVSLRKQEGTPPVRYQTPPDDQQRLQPQNWNPRHGSTSNLPISAEEDENNLDPFLQASDEGSPQVPLKDSPYGPQQGFAQHPHPDQYQDHYRPELARVDTNQGHYLNRGNLEHYSPEQHSGSSGNSAPQPQPYVAYQSEAPSPAQGHPQQGYQPFQPQTQQQGQQQQQQQQHLGQPPSYTAASQHQEAQAFQSPANQASTGFQEAQVIRRPGQQALPAEPNSARPQQQVPPKDSQLLQAGRPSSSQQFSPPSPAGQPYQAYDPAPGSQGSNTPNESDTPQEQNPMAPPTTHNRNNLRSGDLGKQNLPGPPTRESSLQAPPAVGQGPPTPGVSGFSAGVVPQAAQGQPYRGNGKPEGDNGRDTPPLARSIGEMSEEEIADIIKEHTVLREKYQKVKRYFFDQQNQVHQLQNTLANQRMSLSRTSLDDSEYAARFNRLDGLVGQLAHSIRKSWKSIPPWMLPYVNKEAITAGAKEMIIVGRSAIAGWLQDEVFEKYFHPDLELGLSTQLKTVQQNIRKFSPPTHSIEEEEAMWSKIINWRMATLEGLADILRSSQAATNRQRLVEALNEKMIASLEMYLNDSASPELHGNVPMIIELAVGIASHVPMESRDVNIEYYRPGRLIDPEFMKVETGIAALTNPCVDPEGGENASLASAASEAKEDQDPSNAPLREEQKRSRGMFGGLMSTKKAPQPGKPVASGVGGGSQVSLTQQPPGSSSGPKEELPPRVRLAAGLAVQIRGRSILVKAPVYST